MLGAKSNGALHGHARPKVASITKSLQSADHSGSRIADVRCSPSVLEIIEFRKDGWDHNDDEPVGSQHVPVGGDVGLSEQSIRVGDNE